MASGPYRTNKAQELDAPSSSIALIERFWWSRNGEYARGLFLYRPLRAIEADLSRYAEWFNSERTHQGRGQRTPNEVHGRRRRKPAPVPRFAALHVHYLGNDRALPVLRLRRAA